MTTLRDSWPGTVPAVPKDYTFSRWRSRTIIGRPPVGDGGSYRYLIVSVAFAESCFPMLVAYLLAAYWNSINASSGYVLSAINGT